MPDFELTVTCTTAVKDGRQVASSRSVILENHDYKAAIPAGIQAIMQWAAEEIAPDNAPIPAEAIAYWNKARTAGEQLYEIQSALEQNWGISANIREIEKEPPAPQRAAMVRNSAGPRSQPTGAAPRPAMPRPADFRSIVAEQLQILQGRQREIRAEIAALQSELKANQENASQITQFLTINPAPRVRAKGKRRVKTEGRETAGREAEGRTSGTAEQTLVAES